MQKKIIYPPVYDLQGEVFFFHCAQIYAQVIIVFLSQSESTIINVYSNFTVGMKASHLSNSDSEETFLRHATSKVACNDSDSEPILFLSFFSSNLLSTSSYKSD